MAKRSYIIGRAGDISLYDDTVSRRHACLEIDGDRLILRDLDSRNGTYELRDKVLVPFTQGAVTRDQVFAFGECVRSVLQLLAEVGAADALADTAGGEHAATPDPLDVTHVSINVEPRRRLTPHDIVALLDKVEDAIAAGDSLEVALGNLGVTPQRYERWCREHGASRAERSGAEALSGLRRENERLRRLVADLSLENAALKEALRVAQDPPRNDAPPPAATPSLTVVRDKKS